MISAPIGSLKVPNFIKASLKSHSPPPNLKSVINLKIITFKLAHLYRLISDYEL